MAEHTPLTDDQIKNRLKDLPGWAVEGGVLMKTFKVESYIAGAAFAATVATICEGFNHHPDTLCIGWKQVEVTFTTHDQGNVLTPADFEVAATIEALPLKAPKA
jgi:4a-hydroxytetrahydrobiopterin dehydratase